MRDDKFYDSIDYEGLGKEGFLIKTRGEDIYIVGGSSRGTIYGVYSFLEKFCGIRWLTPDVTVLPKKNILQIPETCIIEKPVFEYRDAYWSNAFEGNFCVRNKLNSNKAIIAEEQGGKMRFFNFHHSFNDLVPKEIYYKSHPEYYSEINGVRVADGAQLCLTNPDVFEIALNQLRRWIRENPHCNVFSIAQNDSYGPCTCAKCKVERIKSRLGKKFIVAVRLNIYDGIPYPYGWGVNRENYLEYDLEEALKLVKILHEKGVNLINITMGSPYYNPHVNRPFDKGEYTPAEHPLKGVARLVNGAGEIQRAFPGLAIVGTGYSWIRQFSPYLGAGALEKGYATLIGFGREIFAYPGFPKDLLGRGFIDKRKCCITCGKCTEIMRAGGPAGCVVRDYEVYGKIYRKYCMNTTS